MPDLDGVETTRIIQNLYDDYMKINSDDTAE